MATSVSEKFKTISADLGKAGINALFPNDFEFYMVSLELVDGNGDTLEFFTFPTMPRSLDQVEPQITNIKKSAGGITALSTSTFIPKPINLQGTFGRKFKVLLGQDSFDFTAIRNVAQGRNIHDLSNAGAFADLANIKKAVFDPKIKTGYGAIKILQKICELSTGLEENKPRRLYFYNRTLSESYLVKVQELTLNQNQDQSNLLWQYNLRLMAIAPLEQIIDKKFLEEKVLGIGVIQKSINTLVGDINANILT